MSCSVVSAVQAAARVGVAGLGVAVAGAGSASGEAPVTWQAAVALPAVCTDHTDALAGQLITEQTLRAQRVALTCWKRSHQQLGTVGTRTSVFNGQLTYAATGSELEGRRSASVTAPANHVGATSALTTVGITHCAQ